jgi:hypothetical protein
MNLPIKLIRVSIIRLQKAGTVLDSAQAAPFPLDERLHTAEEPEQENSK